MFQNQIVVTSARVCDYIRGSLGEFQKSEYSGTVGAAPRMLTSRLSISFLLSSSLCRSSSRCFSSCFSSSNCLLRSCSCRSRSFLSCSALSSWAKRSCSLRCCSKRACLRFSNSRLPRSKFSRFLSSNVTLRQRTDESSSQDPQWTAQSKSSLACLGFEEHIQTQSFQGFLTVQKRLSPKFSAQNFLSVPDTVSKKTFVFYFCIITQPSLLLHYPIFCYTEPPKFFCTTSLSRLPTLHMLWPSNKMVS